LCGGGENWEFHSFAMTARCKILQSGDAKTVSRGIRVRRDRKLARIIE
jgi:hypothetical protein